MCVVHAGLPRVLLLLTALLLPGLAACSVVRVPQRSHGRPAGAASAQALLGASEFHKLEFERADPADPTNTVEADLSTMPTLGFIFLESFLLARSYVVVTVRIMSSLH